MQLTARPHVPTLAPPAPGLHALGLGGARDGVLIVPPSGAAELLPLVVMHHGAGADTPQAVTLLASHAYDLGVVLLAPASRDRKTWDTVLGEPGDDEAFLDEALAHVFRRIPIDPRRVVIGGFSDGASHALTVGLANGELFQAVLAFSPGFARPLSPRGKPRLYVTAGASDEVLPVERCARPLVATLKDVGYDVRYEEFDGGHTVPPRLARAGLEWTLGVARAPKDRDGAKRRDGGRGAEAGA